jgi:Uncharacterized ACR, COG1993
MTRRTTGRSTRQSCSKPGRCISQGPPSCADRWASAIRACCTTKIVRLSQDLPLVIEIVDSEEAINTFVDAIEGMMGSALVTTEKVKVIQYGTKRVD